MHAAAHSRPFARPIAPAVLLAGLLIACPACNKADRKPVFPVKLQVLDAQDNPAAGARVTFHPLSAESGVAFKPVGYVNDEGWLVLTSYEEGDGAPAGDYVATVEWRPKANSPFDREKEGKDRLAGKFRDPTGAASKFRYTIAPDGENRLEPLRLK